MRLLALLARHFFGRLFDNEIVSQDSDMRTNAVEALGFFAVPGLFAAFAMLPTFVRYDLPFANHWEFVQDHYFFVLYSIVAMGLVMVFEWDSLFPDRRDYIVLTPLPLGGVTIFTAKLAALVAFLTIFVVDANLLPGVLGPAISAGPGAPEAVALRIAAAQAVACFSGGLFIALALAALQGLLINILTARAFRRVSPWAQMASMALLITALFLTPFLAGSIPRLFEQHSPLLRWFPPFWYLAWFMDMLPGHPAGAMFSELAPLAPRALAWAAAAFAVTYAAGYRRHARRIIEATEITGEAPGRLRRGFARVVNTRLLATPLERATFHFIGNTILRSARHRLFLATGGGIAAAMALPALAPEFVFTPAGLLPLPLILTFLCVIGLRGAFNLPVELRANWVFQTAESEDRVSHIRAARKWILVMALGPLAALLLPFEIAFRGWRGAVHVAFAFALALVLLNGLLIWFRKIPFTCSYFPGKKSMAGMAALLVLGYMFYVLLMAKLEARWLDAPAALAGFFAALAAALAGLRRLEARELRIDDALIYEDQPDPVVRSLELG